MKILSELNYTKSHEWVKFLDDETALIGVTDYAQDQLGDIVFVNLVDVDTPLAVGDTIGDVESVKAVSDVYAPLAGTVTKVNEALFEQPELINQSCYDAWFMELGSVTEKNELLTAEEYEAFISSEEH